MDFRLLLVGIPFPAPIAGLIFLLTGCLLALLPATKKGGGEMTYIENVLICMASPLLIAALCMGKRQTKFFLFCFAGMGACLLSAYINTFLTALYEADTFAATSGDRPGGGGGDKAPAIALFICWYSSRKRSRSKIAAVIVALSFATFEKRLLSDSEWSLTFFLYFLPGHWDRSHARHLWGHSGRRACLCVAADMVKNCRNLRPTGAAITVHAIYNLLIAYGSAAQYIAYLLPVLILTVGKAYLPPSHTVIQLNFFFFGSCFLCSSQIF